MDGGAEQTRLLSFSSPSRPCFMYGRCRDYSSSPAFTPEQSCTYRVLLLCSAKSVKRAGQRRLNLHLFVQRQHPSTCVQLRFRFKQKALRHAVWCESLHQHFSFLFFCLPPCLVFQFCFFFLLSHVCESLRKQVGGSGSRADPTAACLDPG